MKSSRPATRRSMSAASELRPRAGGRSKADRAHTVATSIRPRTRRYGPALDSCMGLPTSLTRAPALALQCCRKKGWAPECDPGPTCASSPTAVSFRRAAQILLDDLPTYGKRFAAVGAVAAMSIHSFVRPGAFDPEAIAVMSEAFDAACKELNDTGQPQIVLEVIAERIIAAAGIGERDPLRLWEAAPPWVGERVFAPQPRCPHPLSLARLFFDPLRHI